MGIYWRRRDDARSLIKAKSAYVCLQHAYELSSAFIGAVRSLLLVDYVKTSSDNWASRNIGICLEGGGGCEGGLTKNIVQNWFQNNDISGCSLTSKRIKETKRSIHLCLGVTLEPTRNLDSYQSQMSVKTFLRCSQYAVMNSIKQAALKRSMLIKVQISLV